MMRFNLLLFFTAIAITASAQWSSLVVFAPRGEKFTLYFNGTRQNNQPAARVEVSELRGPTCKVRLIFETPGIPDVSKTIFNKPAAVQYFAVVRNAKNVFVIEGAHKEWSETPAEPQKQEPVLTPQPVHNEEKPLPVKENTSSTDCNNPISEQDFIASLIAVSAASFDPPKLASAKQLATNHCLTTGQIKEVMDIFETDATRLSFAKFAMDHVSDIDHYSLVKDALHTEKSKNELERYIHSRKQ